jgi:23S rRNA (guanosine2251-2'-O)-methyltransferase
VGDATEAITGLHPAREALRSGRRRLVRLWLAPDVPAELRAELEAAARERGVPVAVATREAERTLAPGAERTQGVILEAGPLPTVALESLAGAPGIGLVALDGVLDPQNLGAILRVADAAGAGGLVLTERRAPPLSAAVARASAGALEHVPVARVPNLPRSLKLLKQKGFWIFGADAREGEDLFALPDRLLAGSRLFVFGSEERGLRPGVLAEVDHRIRIPLRGHVASLNVAAAAAVVLFEVVRRGVGGSQA